MSTSTLTVAAIQLSSQDDVDANLAQCRQWVERAAQAGARLVVLPENFAYFGPDETRARMAEPLTSSEAGSGDELEAPEASAPAIPAATSSSGSSKRRSSKRSSAEAAPRK